MEQTSFDKKEFYFYLIFPNSIINRVEDQCQLQQIITQFSHLMSFVARQCRSHDNNRDIITYWALPRCLAPTTTICCLVTTPWRPQMTKTGAFRCFQRNTVSGCENYPDARFSRLLPCKLVSM